MEKTGQWRFTPPIQVIVALHQAIQEYKAAGGREGRHARYADNCRVLIDGMRALGFRTLLPDALQAPIIVTFHMPADPRFDFQRFYDGLKDRGYDATHMRGALGAVREMLAELGVSAGTPAAA